MTDHHQPNDVGYDPSFDINQIKRHFMDFSLSHSSNSATSKKSIRFRDPTDLFQRSIIRSQVLAVELPKAPAKSDPYKAFLYPPNVAPSKEDLNVAQNGDRKYERRKVFDN